MNPLGEWAQGRERYMKEVPLEALREAFKRQQMNCEQIARRAGMDSTHVRRCLSEVGVMSRKRGKVYGPYPYRTCTYETAVKLARGMGVDPVEVGL